MEIKNNLYFEKMKTTVLFFILLLLLAGKISLASSYKIVSAGFTFSPATLTINPGDEVQFELGGSHNAVQVSKATWDANGSTSNGGFGVPFSGGKVVLTTPGTYYYVCSPHASMGMKGIITVAGVTGIQEKSNIKGNLLSVFPNPATDFFNLSIEVPATSMVGVDLLDITGRKVRSLVSSKFATGDYTLRFPLEGLIPGRYFVRYQHEDQNEVKLLIVTRTN
jgi:plastocyanin